jgi:hypothetical protein
MRWRADERNVKMARRALVGLLFGNLGAIFIGLDAHSIGIGCGVSLAFNGLAIIMKALHDG